MWLEHKATTWSFCQCAILKSHDHNIYICLTYMIYLQALEYYIIWRSRKYTLFNVDNVLGSVPYEILQCGITMKQIYVTSEISSVRRWSTFREVAIHNMNAYVLVQIPYEFSGLNKLHPWDWNTHFHSLVFSVENSFAPFCCNYSQSLQFSFFFILPGARHCWFGRGSME